MCECVCTPLAGGAGIYTDGGSTAWTITSNFVHDTSYFPLERNSNWQGGAAGAPSHIGNNILIANTGAVSERSTMRASKQASKQRESRASPLPDLCSPLLMLTCSLFFSLLMLLVRCHTTLSVITGQRWAADPPRLGGLRRPPLERCDRMGAVDSKRHLHAEHCRRNARPSPSPSSERVTTCRRYLCLYRACLQLELEPGSNAQPEL